MTIRPARPDDARQAARLIYSTGPEAFNLAYGSQDRALSIIARLFAQEGNIASFRYASVAERQGQMVGIFVLHDKTIIRRSQARTGLELLKLVGPLFILFRLPLYRHQSAANPEPAQGELFVADVAVAPEARGRGVGMMLMAEAERVAREGKYTGISLGVRADNLPAVNLYRKMGFEITDFLKDEWLKNRYGFPGAYRMRKSINNRTHAL